MPRSSRAVRSTYVGCLCARCVRSRFSFSCLNWLHPPVNSPSCRSCGLSGAMGLPWVSVTLCLQAVWGFNFFKAQRATTMEPEMSWGVNLRKAQDAPRWDSLHDALFLPIMSPRVRPPRPHCQGGLASERWTAAIRTDGTAGKVDKALNLAGCCGRGPFILKSSGHIDPSAKLRSAST